MATRHGKNAAVTFAGTALGAFCNEGSLSIDIDTAETSVFGQNYKSFLTGQGTATLELSGHYDPAAGGPGAIIRAQLFVDAVAIIWEPGGAVAGQTRYTFNALVTNYSEASSTSDRVTFSTSLQMTGSPTIITIP